MRQLLTIKRVFQLIFTMKKHDASDEPLTKSIPCLILLVAQELTPLLQLGTYVPGGNT